MKNNPLFLDKDRNNTLYPTLQETYTSPESNSGFLLVDSTMPAAHRCQDILDSLEANDKIIVEGSTGSGKTTQICLALAEKGYKVYISQPRILAAREVAEYLRRYLAPIMGEENARNFVGYSTEPETDTHPDNRIVFATDGKLRRRLLYDQDLEQDIVVIADEVHEMTVDTELLVATTVLLDGLKTIYQSASCDTERLAEYTLNSTNQDEVPIISIEGRIHEIDEIRGGSMSYEIAKYGDAGNVVLGFVDTKDDVNRMVNKVRGKLNNKNIAVLALHGDQTPEEQRKVFDNYPNGKIIIATSIAETSITIPDVDVVVDGGYHRTNGIDGNSKRTLPILPITKDKSDQRRGRCGRTKKGTYVMAQQDFRDPIDWDNLESYSQTALSRSHLASPISSFLGSTSIRWGSLPFYSEIDPSREEEHIRLLRNLGAVASDGSPTLVGAEISRYPVDHSYARMLVESKKYLPEVQLQMAAAISATESSGILKSDIKYGELIELTDDLSDSTLLTNLSILLETEVYDEGELKNLGIVIKKLNRARAKLQSLRERMGLHDVDLVKPTSEQRDQLLSCIISGSEEAFIARNHYTTTDNNGSVIRLSPTQRQLGGPKAIVLGQQLNIQRPNAGFNGRLIGATTVTANQLLEYAPDRCDLIPSGVRFNRNGKLVGDFEVAFDGVRTRNSVTIGTTINEEIIGLVVDYILFEPQSAKFAPEVKVLQNIIDFIFQLSLKAEQPVDIDNAIESIKSKLTHALLSSSASRCEEIDMLIPDVLVTDYFDIHTMQNALKNAPDKLKLGNKSIDVAYENGVVKLLLPRKIEIPTKALLEEKFGDRKVLLKVPRLAGGYRTIDEINELDNAPTRHHRRNKGSKATLPDTKKPWEQPEYPRVTSQLTAMSTRAR